MKKILFVVFVVLINASTAFAQMPNKKAVVEQLAREGLGATLMQGCKSLTGKSSCAAFTRLVACTLEPDGFGLLTKSSGENNIRGFGVDAIIHNTNQVVDVIGSSESSSAKPAWTLVSKRPTNNFAKPIECVPVVVPPPPPPPPSSDLEEKVDLLSEDIQKVAESISWLSRRVDALEAQKPPPGDTTPEQLLTTKAILELLQKVAERFGVK